MTAEKINELTAHLEQMGFRIFDSVSDGLQTKTATMFVRTNIAMRVVAQIFSPEHLASITDEDDYNYLNRVYLEYAEFDGQTPSQTFMVVDDTPLPELFEHIYDFIDQLNDKAFVCEDDDKLLYLPN
jgi:hypothetical protein